MPHRSRDEFVHQMNVAKLQAQLRNPLDDAQREVLQQLLAEEMRNEEARRKLPH